MAHGFSYDEAWHMAYRDYRRFTAIASAWSIPPSERAGLTVKPTSDNDEGYY